MAGLFLNVLDSPTRGQASGRRRGGDRPARDPHPDPSRARMATGHRIDLAGWARTGRRVWMRRSCGRWPRRQVRRVDDDAGQPCGWLLFGQRGRRTRSRPASEARRLRPHHRQDFTNCTIDGSQHSFRCAPPRRRFPQLGRVEPPIHRFTASCAGRRRRGRLPRCRRWASSIRARDPQPLRRREDSDQLNRRFSICRVPVMSVNPRVAITTSVAYMLVIW